MATSPAYYSTVEHCIELQYQNKECYVYNTTIKLFTLSISLSVKTLSLE